MKKYKVRFRMDQEYEVVELTYSEHYLRDNRYSWEPTEEESVFQGGLADCEAYIRLKEGGYM